MWISRPNRPPSLRAPTPPPLPPLHPSPPKKAMPTVPLSAPPSLPPYLLLEYNGSLLPPTPLSSPSCELGLLSLHPPRVVTGTHELRGRLIPLPTPVLICRRGGGGVVVEGVAEEKVLFDGYPKTIMR